MIQYDLHIGRSNLCFIFCILLSVIAQSFVRVDMSKVTGKRKFVPAALTNAANSVSPPEGEDPLSNTVPLSVDQSITRLLDQSLSSAGQSEWSRSVTSSFRNVLYQYVGPDVQENESDVIFSNDVASLIVDAYPKAALHLLLLPKESFLSAREVRDLHTSQMEKIQQFHQLAREIAASIEQEDPTFELISPKWHRKLRDRYLWKQPIKCGYHVIPSLYPLHLHIISSDFISPTLKNKGHWNKFTTEYLVSIDEVEKSLREKVRDGILRSVMEDDAFYELLLKRPLTCHHCGEIFPTMPKLKWHVEDCMLSDV